MPFGAGTVELIRSRGQTRGTTALLGNQNHTHGRADTSPGRRLSKLQQNKKAGRELCSRAIPGQSREVPPTRHPLVGLEQERRRALLPNFGSRSGAKSSSTYPVLGWGCRSHLFCPFPEAMGLWMHSPRLTNLLHPCPSSL